MQEVNRLSLKVAHFFSTSKARTIIETKKQQNSYVYAHFKATSLTSERFLGEAVCVCKVWPSFLLSFDGCVVFLLSFYQFRAKCRATALFCLLDFEKSGFLISCSLLFSCKSTSSFALLSVLWVGLIFESREEEARNFLKKRIQFGMPFDILELLSIKSCCGLGHKWLFSFWI